MSSRSPRISRRGSGRRGIPQKFIAPSGNLRDQRANAAPDRRGGALFIVIASDHNSPRNVTMKFRGSPGVL